MEYPSSKVRILVRTRNSRLLETIYFPPKGTPENTMTEEELKDKYRECAEWGGIAGERIEESLKMLMENENLEDVGDLMRLMQ